MKVEDALWQDSDRLSGAVCFRGTRVPVSILFEYLEVDRLDDFFRGYPNVKQDQVEALLERPPETRQVRLSRRDSVSTAQGATKKPPWGSDPVHSTPAGLRRGADASCLQV